MEPELLCMQLLATGKLKTNSWEDWFKCVQKGIYSERDMLEKVCKENTFKMPCILKTWGAKCNPDGESSTVSGHSVGTLGQYIDGIHRK